MNTVTFRLDPETLKKLNSITEFSRSMLHDPCLSKSTVLRLLINTFYENQMIDLDHEKFG